MEKQLKRSEVPEALKWDLTLLYESDEAMERNKHLPKRSRRLLNLPRRQGILPVMVRPF